MCLACRLSTPKRTVRTLYAYCSARINIIIIVVVVVIIVGQRTHESGRHTIAAAIHARLHQFSTVKSATVLEKPCSAIRCLGIHNQTVSPFTRT